MAKKKIKFIYYKSCAKDDEITIDFEDYLKILMEKYNDYKYEFSNGNIVRVNYIKKHEVVECTEGVLNYDWWEVHFVKSTIESPEKYNVDNNKITNLDLHDNERVAERNVLLYDPTTKIIIMSKNQKGASSVNIRDFMNSITHEELDKIEFIPVLDDADLEALLGRITSLTFRVNNTAKLINKNYDEGAAIVDVFKSINTLQDKPEDAIQVDVNISIGDNRKHDKLLSGKGIAVWLDKLKKWVHSGDVNKLSVKTIDDKTNKINMIDLIENTIFDEEYFDIDVNSRSVDPKKIITKMTEKYNSKRNKYLLE